MFKEPEISVVVPTHNPNLIKIKSVIRALNQQTLSHDSWELIIVDNASNLPIKLSDVHANVMNAKVVREDRLGLTSARWRGIAEATAPLIVFVDDDNILNSFYLEEATKIFNAHPRLGAAGGKSIPDYEKAPPLWFSEGMAPLGCRDLGDIEYILKSCEYTLCPAYPTFAPVGAGMVLRKDATVAWCATALASPVTDRRGSSLSSAGDCDLVLHVLESGWDVGYFPSLSLTHLIDESRVNPTYLEQISRSAFRDFISVLDLHGMRPWRRIHPASIPLRALRAWFACRAWRGSKEQLRWQTAIGQFEGRAALPRR